MGMTTDPGKRQALITGLRELADFLAANPAVPVPGYGCEITMFPYGGTDEDKARAVDAFASAAGADVLDDRAVSGRYQASRVFGPVVYRTLTHTAACMAEFEARHSYADCIQTGSTSAHGDAGEMAEAA